MAAANFRETSNGRFDALLHDDNKLTSVVEAMCELAALQQAVGRRNVPLLVVWGVDVATTAQLEELTAVTAAFLATVRPEMLMLTGRRAPDVAFQAEVLLRRVLGAASGFKPKTLITGGADGIDAVALRLANDEPAASPGLKVTGEYTPTAFARADTPDHKINPKPVALRGLSPGRSPICDASAMVPRQHGDADFHEFLSLMEGQWAMWKTAGQRLRQFALQPRQRSRSGSGPPPNVRAGRPHQPRFFIQAVGGTRHGQCAAGTRLRRIPHARPCETRQGARRHQGDAQRLCRGTVRAPSARGSCQPLGGGGRGRGALTRRGRAGGLACRRLRRLQATQCASSSAAA